VTAGFLPGLLIGLLLLAFWLDSYGIAKWRAQCAREQAWARGECIDCGEPEDDCSCIVFTPDDWDDE
jgi:hypothetical protein